MGEATVLLREAALAASKLGMRANPRYIPAALDTVAAILANGLELYGPDPEALARHLLGHDIDTARKETGS